MSEERRTDLMPASSSLLGYWNTITILDAIPATYPNENHIYVDAEYYITYSAVVTLYGEAYANSLQAIVSNATLPLLTIEATTWNKGDAAAALPVLTASGQRSNQSTANLALPKLISSGLIDDLTGRADLTLPRMTIAANASQANLVTLSKVLPALKASGQANQLNYGIADIGLAALTCSARGFENLSGDIALILPTLAVRAEASRNGRGFTSRILKHDYDTWAYVKAELPEMRAQ